VVRLDGMVAYTALISAMVSTCGLGAKPGISSNMLVLFSDPGSNPFSLLS